jgi:hypothetical protein
MGSAVARWPYWPTLLHLALAFGIDLSVRTRFFTAPPHRHVRSDLPEPITREMTKGIVALGIAVVAFGCASSRRVSAISTPTPPAVARSTLSTTPLDAARTEIYQHVIQEIVQLDERGRSAVVSVTIEIHPADPHGFWQFQMDGLVPRLRLWVDQDTITDWLSDSSVAHDLAEALEGIKYASVVPPGVCDGACFNGDVASVSVSGIGLNTDRTRALLWTDYTCGSLCGRSYDAVLEKHEGAWRTEILDSYPNAER